MAERVVAHLTEPLRGSTGTSTLSSAPSASQYLGWRIRRPARIFEAADVDMPVAAAILTVANPGRISRLIWSGSCSFSSCAASHVRLVPLLSLLG